MIESWTRRYQGFSKLLILASAGLVLATLGCAGSAWDKAVKTDTPAAYYRFMRDHPGSDKQAAAQERLDFHKLKRNLSLAGFDAFLEKYPDTVLLDEVRPRLEPKAFAVARAQGTAEAYEGFIAQFPNGELKARAEGNAAYLRAAGFAGDSDSLAQFAIDHPESDFAGEAQRTASTVALRNTTRFWKVGLVLEIAPGTAQAKEIRAKFVERAKDIYEDAGVELIEVPEIVNAATASGLPRARLVVRHSEEAVGASYDGGSMSRPGIVATTRVTLVANVEREAIFDRTFSLRVDPQQHLQGTSVLFSSAAPLYWDAFFVPVATWQTNAAVRPPVSFESPVVAVDAAGDRSVVMFENGHFQVIELADPAAPVVLAEYTRPNDFKKWSGVKILGDRIAIFGEEGIELVGFGTDGPQPVASWSRGKIGTVFSIEPLGEHLVVAGASGLLLADPSNMALKRMMRRVIIGMATVGDTLVFTDGESLFVSNMNLLAQQRVSAQLRLGKQFAPGLIRSFDQRAVAIGKGGVVVLDLSNGSKPVVTAKLHTREVGVVTDATAMGSRIFLSGERGLQMLDARGVRPAESIDVEARRRIATMGRHVVSIGESRMQLVDTTPLLNLSKPASASAEMVEKNSKLGAELTQ